MTNQNTNTSNVVIPSPNFKTAEFTIRGTSPYVQLKFSQKVKEMLKAAHEEGQKSKKGKKKEPRNFDEDYQNSIHYSTEGWVGMPAAGFRNATISACRTVNFKMTLAKLSVFFEADGYDRDDGTPLIKIEGKPEKVMHHVRNQTGVVDLRVRAMWREWTAKVRVKWDADQFNLTDVTNLLQRVGLQVGIGEGRPDSKLSCGMGWGLFDIVNT